MKQNHKKQYAPPALRVADLLPESRFLLSGSTGGGSPITSGGNSEDNPSRHKQEANHRRILGVVQVVREIF